MMRDNFKHRQLEHAVVATLLLRGSEFDGDAFQRSIVLTTMQREANRADRVAIDGFRIHNPALRSEEHTSELKSLIRISYAVFCLKHKKNNHQKMNISLH